VPSDVFFVPGPQPWAPADGEMDLTALNIAAPISSGEQATWTSTWLSRADCRGGPTSKRGVEIIRSSARWSTLRLGQAVTGQVRHHGNATHPTPERLLEPFVGVHDRRVRGITIGQEDDVLWW
jgi:hypothetical protein